MKRSTYYEVLGVERDASEAEIRSAFRKLARDLHPDRLDGDARAAAEKQFQAVTEAFNILSRPDQRTRYDKEIATGGTSAGSMDPREIAKKLAAKGAQLFKDGKLPEAINHLIQAVNHDDNQARAHYFLGQAYLMTPGKARDGLRHMDRATQLEPNNTTIKAETASAFFDAGMKTKAERLATEVLGLDPSNAKAISVLELIGAERSSKG